jgi:hypothetical protein
MPLQKLQFKAGVNRESTNYANEGGWWESEKVRFRSGFPQKIGGWTSISDPATYTFKGVARNLWVWVTLAFQNLMALGTNQKFYVENGGFYHDITPLTSASPVTLGANPIATTSGSLLVTITAASHGTNEGTYVTFSGATAVGGITINGEYEIVTIPDGNSFTIVHSTAASSTATGGGSAVVANYQINAGNSVYTTGTGWGAGTWGRGGWGSAATVTVGSQLRLWSMDNFGEDLLFAPRGGALYYWEADTTTWLRALELASVATTNGYDGTFVPNTVLQIVASDAQRFTIVMGSNPYDPTNSETVFNPMLVRWSDQENPYQWIPAVTNQSGEYALTGGSTIVAARNGRQEILIWTDASLYSMQYLGPPYVWGFNLLMDNISVISPNSMIVVNTVAYWMGVDKFYMYSGRVQTLSCTLRQFVFNNLNQDQAYQVVCGANEAWNEVWWFYPSLGSNVNDSYVIYNYLEDTWYYGTMNRTAWLDSPLRSFPMGSFSVQNSYLGVALTAAATQINLMDGSSYPSAGTVTIDSEDITYTGVSNNALTGCIRGVNSTTAATHVQYSSVLYKPYNQVMYHEDGIDDNSGATPVAIDAYIQSSDFDIGDGHNFGFVWRMIPDVTFSGSTATSPQLMIVVKPRQASGAAYGAPDPNAVINTVAYPVEQYTEQVYTRIRGRQMAFKIESDALGVTWQLGATRIDIRPDGRR